MSMLLPDVLLIPYAADQWSLAAMKLGRATRRGIGIEASFPLMVVNKARREPLRLNNAPWVLNPQTTAGQSVTETLRAHVRQMCRPWDRTAQAFVDAYFDHLLKEATDDAALRERSETFANLYAPLDWLYSAPRPLPRAHLYAPEAAPTGTEADFVQVDFAFWLGGTLTAAVSKDAGLSPPKARARVERLANAGITRVVSFSVADLTEPQRLFTDLLDGPPSRYWSQDPVPCGPFRPRLFDD
ncbi:MAG: hypothetical protein JWM36_2346 [Hyphomicrobiales bacterium]|nr:hypothetical protein [Hyphomicrobiales bacterium]